MSLKKKKSRYVFIGLEKNATKIHPKTPETDLEDDYWAFGAVDGFIGRWTEKPSMDLHREGMNLCLCLKSFREDFLADIIYRLLAGAPLLSP
jgi:hypothetical protein